MIHVFDLIVEDLSVYHCHFNTFEFNRTACMSK
jgi:hypothetical protein